jgi:hypothetical protein
MAKTNKYDSQHWRNQAAYERQIDAIYRTAAKEAAALGVSIKDFNPDRLFSFSDYPNTRKKIEKLLNDLQSGVTAVIVNGIRSEWTLANNKNDELARQVFGDSVGKLTKELERRYFSTNGAARDAFIKRKTDGLGLSDRVWKYTNQFKEEIELGLDLGIRSGRSADELSRDLRSYLQHPDKLFRRVRNKHGQLVLSQRARAYHPGRGVYRSSYKNARRLAATETNIAYRTADYERWQQLDFVVGIEIKLSNNHPEPDICDDLKGRYPKDFKFTGWHPHCRCHVETVLKTPDELIADNRRIMEGGKPTETSVNTVADVPQAFTDWVEANRERMTAAKSLPYFIRDNSKYVERTPKATTPSQLEDVLQLAEKASVEYLAVSELSKTLTEDEIISRVSGGDLTTGSCSSLAFTYAGNRCGFDVLDFRGGMSQSFFSRTGNIMSIAEKVGGTVAKHTNDYKKAKDLLKTTQMGKEYYFTCGSHAAIVRRTETGFEYLELQSPYVNGFKPLDENVLKRRFAAKKSHTVYGTKCETRDCIIDIDLLRKDSGFRRMLGYINTAKDKQRKGKSGTTR